MAECGEMTIDGVLTITQSCLDWDLKYEVWGTTGGVIGALDSNSLNKHQREQIIDQG